MLALFAAVLLQQGPVEVEVLATDRPVVRGTLATDRFALETEFGSAQVKAARLARIVFGTPDVVVTDANVELRGKLQLDNLDLKVAGKPQRVPRKVLQSLFVLRDGRRLGGGDFTGSWVTGFGPMELTQTGLTVTGTMGYDGNGKVDGKVDGKTLRFRYENGGQRGEARLELWDDGEVVAGSYGDSGKDEGFWGGYRKKPQRAQCKPGEVAAGQCENGLRYCVRAPKGFDGKRTFPAICILHGSNMNSRAYVDTIASAWPDLADQYLVVGIDGENLSQASKPGELRFNYSYINFSGPGVGPPWVQRQSPALVAEALRQLGKELPVERWFLGGHSQGGFLTYCMVMYYPELLAGAFPMSCNLLVQCEPDEFDAEAAKRQHAVAVAVVHGQADDVVEYSGGRYCHVRLLDGGFPAVKLFAPEKIGHQFALLPVADAVRWLAAVRGKDAAALAAFAQEREKQKAWREAGAAVAWARAQKLDARPFDAVEKAMDAACEAQVKSLQQRMAKDDPAWVDDFLELRREFALSPAVQPLLQRYGELRARQQSAADKLFGEARNLRDKAAREDKYRELLGVGWATKWYEVVKMWLE